MSNATASSRRPSLRLDGSEPMVAMLSPSQPDVCRFTRTTLVAARFGYIHTITQLSDLERRCLSCESKRAAAPAPADACSRDERERCGLRDLRLRDAGLPTLVLASRLRLAARHSGLLELRRTPGERQRDAMKYHAGITGPSGGESQEQCRA